MSENGVPSLNERTPLPVVSHLQLVLSHSVQPLSKALYLGLILLIHLLEERRRIEDKVGEEAMLKNRCTMKIQHHNFI